MRRLGLRVLLIFCLFAGVDACAQPAPFPFPFLIPPTTPPTAPPQSQPQPLSPLFGLPTEKPASPPREFPYVRAVPAKNGMVVASEPRATRIGVEILQKGGNAVDAAVAVGFALAVTYPSAGNIGGGGFMVIHLAARNENVAIDYREMAPAATARDTYLDDKGEADPNKSREQGLAIGVPGTVAGLAHAHAKYGSGKFTLAQLIEPAIALARDGFPASYDLADSLIPVRSLLARWPSSAKIFLRKDGQPLAEGDRLVQTDLAASLTTIANDGPRAFYEGLLAEKIVNSVRAANGLMTLEDMKSYRVVERTPVRGTYRGYNIISMPPPSSGGALLIEMLNVLEGYTLRPHDATTMHLIIETMKRAYADRAQFLGDPDQVKVPLSGLISKKYAEALRADIDPNRAKPSSEIRAGNAPGFEHPNTTHYSIVDQFGNAVATTYTLNLNYGVGLVAEGTGILLNNELDDFAAKPGAPNAFGLIGYDANAPGPSKRPLSSMTPTIVLKDGKPYIVTGSPGGSRIITAVLQILIHVIDYRMGIAEAVAAPRIHHQWLPDQAIIEPGLPTAALQSLVARGQNIVVGRLGTSANSILISPEGPIGAADTRSRAAVAVGY
jgi:gamma-glutamyltranspeptidase / glutathione hydrolase